MWFPWILRTRSHRPSNLVPYPGFLSSHPEKKKPTCLHQSLLVPGFLAVSRRRPHNSPSHTMEFPPTPLWSRASLSAAMRRLIPPGARKLLRGSPVRFRQPRDKEDESE